MDKQGLTRIGAGFYIDSERRIYFHVREFMAAHNLPDALEVRQAVWAEVRRSFGNVAVIELTDS
jgi:hypothetical protein